MATFKSLGVKRIINASANNSKAGSSCLSKEVMAAMSAAAECYVDMDELHDKCGQYIAKITGAQAGLITSGASGGLLLAAAACITRGDKAKMLRLPTSAEGSQIIVQKGHRSGYDMAVETSGARLVEVGLPFKTYPQEIEAAINDHTAAILFTIGEFICARGEVPLEEVLRIGKKHDVPVILDGSLIIFPFDRLRKYVQMGVDLLVASGGKHIFGPPGTGFLCGRSDLVAACREQAGPAFGIGRPLKIGKEEMMGLITALEIYLKMDVDAEIQKWRSSAEKLLAELKHLPHLRAEITDLDEVGRPVARVILKVDEEKLGRTAFEIAAQLRSQPPYIWVQEFNLHEGILILNPLCLQAGDEDRLIEGFTNLWAELAPGD